MKSSLLGLLGLLAVATAGCSSVDEASSSDGADAEADGSADAVDEAADGSDEATASEDAGVDAGRDAAQGDAADGNADPVGDECKAGAYTDKTCGKCMEANCYDVCAACVLDTECTAWLDCAMQCWDQACQDACTQQYPDGEPLALAWFGNDGCIGLLCCADCGGCSQPYCDTGLTTNNDECDACLADNCCSVTKDCQADPDCNDCLMNGTQDACGGNESYAALYACWTVTCGDACPADQGCGLSTSGANPACDTCIETNCCDQGIACVDGSDADHDGQADCLDVLACVQDCATGDTGCEGACHAAQPDGAALLDDFFGCLHQACASDCAM